ncbi:MAG: sensor histidine kinase [Thermoanaerobaculia bacterium]
MINDGTLRSKLTILISVGVLVFGSVNLVVVGRLAYRAVTEEQQTWLRSTASLLAERAEMPIFHNDLVGLDRLVRQSVSKNGELAYVMILDAEGTPVVHSFDAGPPTWITSATLSGRRRPEFLLVTSPDGRRFIDVSSRIRPGPQGQVRLGIDAAGARASVMNLLSWLATMVLALLLAGLVAARWVATWVTAPAERIAAALDEFRLGGPRVVIDVKSGDELGRLAERVEAIMHRIEVLHQNELAQQRELARIERLAAVGTLTAGLAHEINNPLAGIKQAAESLDSRPDDAARVRRYIPVILQAARRMERILGDLLRFARPARHELKQVVLCDVMYMAARLAAPRAKQAGAEVRIECNAPHLAVKADADALIQALLNLFLNAADAVSESPDRSISARCTPDESGDVTILVSDSGPGVADENRERIFEPFFSTKAPGKGTGLGLATAWTAIHQMGGVLRLEQSDGGASFAIVLPEWKNGDNGTDSPR